MPPALIAWAARWEVPVARGAAIKLLNVEAFASGCGTDSCASIWLPVWQ
jgi:hypothetical protein